MEFLGVGPAEFLFFLVILLIVLGPKDLAKAGRTIGRWLNAFVRSDTWRTLIETSRQVRQLPYQLMREANLEEDGASMGPIAPPSAFASPNSPPPTHPMPAQVAPSASAAPKVGVYPLKPVVQPDASPLPAQAVPNFDDSVDPLGSTSTNSTDSTPHKIKPYPVRRWNVQAKASSEDMPSSEPSDTESHPNRFTFLSS